MAKLVLLLSDGTAQDIFLNKERITLGRRADNDVCLPHPAVSGEHAAVVTILSDSFLEDLASTNGTLVNGKPVGKHFLRDGDVIDVGQQCLVYLVDESAQPDAIAAAPAPEWSREPGQNPAAATERTQWIQSPGAMNGGAPITAPVAPAGTDTHQPSSRATDGVITLDERAAALRGEPGMGPPQDVRPSPDLIVLTGPNAGRTLTLTKEVTSVGRAGVQVALIRRTAEGFLILPGDGSSPPLLNGAAIRAEGSLLEPGDILEVAGARIEYGAVPDLPT